MDKFQSTKKTPKIDAGKKWWASLSEEEKIAYREKKEKEKNELDTLYSSSTEKVDALFSNIGQLTKDDLKEMFDSMVHFHQYSAMNNLFIGVQNREATTVAGKKKWYSYGYKLKKEALPIYICAPVEKVIYSQNVSKEEYSKIDWNPTELRKFVERNKIKSKVNQSNFVEQKDGNYKFLIRTITSQFNDKVKVYDISDVEPIIKDWVDHSRDLNDLTIACSIDYDILVSHIEKSFWYEIVEKPMKVQKWGFVVVWDTTTISINSNLKEHEKAGILIHELSHLLLWHTEEDHDKKVKWTKEFDVCYAINEIQAETLAYLFREQLWIKCKSEEYILSYMLNKDLWDRVLEKTLRKAVQTYDMNKWKFKVLQSDKN